MSDSDEWHLPVRPVSTPPDVAAALAAETPDPIVLTKPDGPGPASREARDAFMERHSHGGRAVASIFSGRSGEEYGR